MSQEFSWNDTEAIIVKRTDAIAVYSNPEGNIVIRQEGIDYGDDPGDQVIVIPRDRVSDVIEALSKELVAGAN